MGSVKDKVRVNVYLDRALTNDAKKRYPSIIIILKHCYHLTNTYYTLRKYTRLPKMLLNNPIYKGAIAKHGSSDYASTARKVRVVALIASFALLGLALFLANYI